MRESSRGRSPRSKLFKEQSFFQKSQRTNVLPRKLSRFGVCVVALWPHKPARHLADRLGITEENANQLIRGDRKVTAKAAAVINNEII